MVKAGAVLAVVALCIGFADADQPDFIALKKQAKNAATEARNHPDKALNKLVETCRRTPGPWSVPVNSINFGLQERKDVFVKNLDDIIEDKGTPFTVKVIDCFALLTSSDKVFYGIRTDGRPTSTDTTDDPFSDDTTTLTGRKLMEATMSAHTAGLKSGRQLQGKGKGKGPPSLPPPPPPPPSPSPSPSPRNFPSPLPVPSPVPRPTCSNIHDCDWRNVNARSYVPAARNQGSCGSCWAFAGRGVWEAAMMVAGQIASVPATSTPPDMASSQFIVNCAPNVANGQLWTGDNPNRCANGGWPDEAFALFSNRGYITEASMTYTSGTNTAMQTCVLPNTAAWPSSTSAGSYFVPLDRWANGFNVNNVASLKQALASGGPLAVIVQANSWGGYTSGVLPCGSVDEASYNHAVMLVGVTTVMDASGVLQEVWVIQNSWGTGWGFGGGYGYIPTDITRDCGVSQWWAGRPNIRPGTLA